jgi:hypothetical protein
MDVHSWCLHVVFSCVGRGLAKSWSLIQGVLQYVAKTDQETTKLAQPVAPGRETGCMHTYVHAVRSIISLIIFVLKVKSLRLTSVPLSIVIRTLESCASCFHRIPVLFTVVHTIRVWDKCMLACSSSLNDKRHHGPMPLLRTFTFLTLVMLLQVIFVKNYLRNTTVLTVW